MGAPRRKDDPDDLKSDQGKPHYGHAYHCTGGSYSGDGGPHYRAVLWHGTNGRIIHETASIAAQQSLSKIDALQKLTEWCEENGVAATIHWPDGQRLVHPGHRSVPSAPQAEREGAKPAQETTQAPIVAPGGSDDGVDLPF